MIPRLGADSLALKGCQWSEICQSSSGMFATSQPAWICLQNAGHPVAVAPSGRRGGKGLETLS